MLTCRVAQGTRLFVWCALALILRAVNANAQTSALPAPWNAQDVGTPSIPGTVTEAQNVFTVTAAGKDIASRSDQFYFVYQQVAGDVDIIARVDSVTAVQSGSKAGVMIRSSLAADAAHGYVSVSAGRGIAFQTRTSTGTNTSSASGGSAGPPRWVRIVRTGSTLTGYTSADGSAWTTISSRTVTMGASAYVGLATTSRSASAATTAALSQVAVVPLALPSPQKAADVGAPAIAGSSSYRQGTYSIHAGGADIGDSSDQFHFVYQQLTGDLEVVARVNSVAPADAGSRSGVMIRESLAAGSRHAYASLSAGNGYAFERRADSGGLTDRTAGPSGAAPGWLRLVRTGSQIEAFRSQDGATWQSMGSDAIPMTDSVYVGIATTSHSAAKATDAAVASFKVTPIVATPNQPPIVALTSPASGSIVTAGGNVPLAAAASDSDGTIARVDFFSGTTLIGSDTAAPYTATWSSVATGTYSLTAVATDNDGARTTSATVTINAASVANQPPTVTLTAPSNGTSFVAPATISLTASAADTDGSVSRVEFYAGSTLLGSDTSAPYAFSWSGAAAGSYGLRAVAYDNANATASSATATVTVTTGTSSGLVAAYALNAGTGSTVPADAGTGPQGTITAATWTTGKFGQALSFAGNGVVNFGDVDLAGSLTVMGWLQTRSLYTNTCGSFVMKARDYGFEICGGRLYASVGANGAWTARVSQALTTADLNVWKHVALTYDGTTARLYVGGVLVNSATGAHVSNSDPLLFGRWNPASEFWNGLIDEVRLYSRALTQAQIQADMNTAIASASGNKPPTVTLTGPSNGASFTAPATIAFAATASDPENALARVEFYSGTTLLGSDTTAPYAFSWGSVAAGTYSLHAVAYDTTGASATSATATVTVGASGNKPPTVTLTGPSNGATFTAPATIAFAATASDPENALARVEFYSGTTLLGSDTTAPFSYSWGSVPAGAYTLRAVAYDTAGASASSVANAVTVTTTTTSPPRAVVFQASADHATLVTRYELRIFASGANPLTATPLVTSDLGKPTPASNGDITVDRATVFSALAVGNYVAAVSAIGSGGTSTSTEVAFTR